MTNHPSEGNHYTVGMSPEDYSEGLRVLLEVLDPVLHHSQEGLAHEEAVEPVLKLLLEDRILLARTVDMFASLVMMLSLADGHAVPCGYLHDIVDVYKERLAELN